MVQVDLSVALMLSAAAFEHGIPSLSRALRPLSHALDAPHLPTAALEGPGIRQGDKTCGSGEARVIRRLVSKP